MKAKLKNYHCTMHMALQTVHMSKYSGTIDCPGNIVHNKTIIFEQHTPKSTKTGNFGKPKTWFYIGEPCSPTFMSMESLEKHYKIKFKKNEHK